jgi:hypothetical protein
MKKTPCTRQTKAIFSAWTFLSGLESGLFQLGIWTWIGDPSLPNSCTPLFHTSVQLRSVWYTIHNFTRIKRAAIKEDCP